MPATGRCRGSSWSGNTVTKLPHGTSPLDLRVEPPVAADRAEKEACGKNQGSSVTRAGTRTMAILTAYLDDGGTHMGSAIVPFPSRFQSPNFS
jgi:hypothetical protein